jgi:hypothetical protein
MDCWVLLTIALVVGHRGYLQAFALLLVRTDYLQV